MPLLGPYLLTAVLLLAAQFCSFAVIAAATGEDAYSFVYLPTDYQDDHPDWFKASFHNLPEDLDDTLASGKQGLIVYFGQRHCPYCQAIMKDNLSRSEEHTSELQSH